MTLKEHKFVEDIRLLFEKHKIEYLKVTTVKTVLDNKINGYHIHFKNESKQPKQV